jgi:hypothetical protein
MNAIETMTAQSDEQILALAAESESFYMSGISPEDSLMRQFLIQTKLDNTACGLLFLSHMVFHECYIRGINRRSDATLN